jgi:hypothetical protein
MRLHRWQLSVIIVFALLSGAGLSAFANHSTSMPTMTGCLNTAAGTIGKIKQGVSGPLSACSSGEVKLHLSGGDITRVIPAVNGGLTGGGTDGDVTLRVDFAQLDRRYGGPGARIKFVGSHGTPVANGTALRDTLAAITNATAEDPWLVMIGPGTFDLGDTTLALKDHVAVEGSGHGTTILLSTAYTAITGATMTLRDLTLGISSLDLEWGTGYGISVSQDTMIVEHVAIYTDMPFGYGISASNSPLRIRDSIIHASAMTVYDLNWNTTPSQIWIVDSELSGRVVGNSARCRDVHDTTWYFLGDNCY